MPLLSPDNDQMTLPDVRGSLPQRAPTPAYSGLDFAAAVERRSNLAGTLYEHFTSPPPQEKNQPGFDPEVSVPKGAEGHAEIFANATGPQDIAWREQQYQREQLDNRIIQAHGGWGLAATMAAGATDPVSLASMAIPVAGPTRLIQAGKLALASGVTAAAEEGAMHELEVSRSLKSSALNVAAATVLGGVLGAAIRPRVPAREFDAMADVAHEELHGEATTENAMGPIDGRQRIVPETDVKVEPIAEEPPKYANARYIASQANEQLTKREAVLQEAAEGKEAQAVNLRNDDKDVFRRLDEAQKALDESSETLMQDRATQVKEAAMAFARRDQANDYAIQRAREAGVPEEIHPDVQARAEESVDLTRANAQKVADLARKSLQSLQEDADRIRRVRGAESDLQLHRNAVKSAKSLDEAIEALPKPLQERFRQQLRENETPAESLNAQGQPLIPERAEGAPKPMTELPPVPDTLTEHINPNAESTTGAAAVTTPTMRGESIARGAETLSKTLGKVSPGARLMNSASLKVRQLVQELANLPETLTKNYDGRATASPIERELWKYDGVHNQGMQARGKLYKAYRERIAGEGGEPMVRGEFNQEISKAMRRGDAHPVPEVAQAAKETRAIEFEPLKQRAIKAGLLPEDVKAKGADSYLMRQYDAAKIRDNMTDWLDRLKRGFVAQGVDTAEAADIAYRVTRNIQGSERGTLDIKALDGITPKSGQLKERTLDLPDTLLEPYLNNDIDHVAHSYQRSMGPEVEMTERFGSRDMKDQISEIHDDYARMIERAPDDKAKAALSNRMDKDLRDLTAVRDRLYGIYGQPKDPGHFAVRAGRLLRSENALRLLGAATLAHFPDLANVMMRFGLPQTFSAIGKVLTSPGAFSLTRSEAKRMGAGLDMAMNATASMLGDYATHSQYGEQRVMNYLTRKFTILTGETPLITAVQQLTSTMAQDSLIRTAQKVAAGQNVDKNLLARIAGAGIDQDALKGIAAQHEQFGAKVNGLHFGMSDQWADQALASKFESAILRDAHSVTLRPGVGDTPLFMSTEWGKALRQFTTFGYAAQRSVVNPLMQGVAHGDPRAATALMALAAMGTLSYVSKQTAAGQPIEPFDSPRFALEVLDKSNMMGWTADVVFPALWMAGFKNLSRWSDRDPVETIGGPAVGTVFSTYAQQLPSKFLASIGINDDENKGLKRSDLHFLRRLMPGQNLWYLRNHINSLEDAMGDAFNLPGKSNADRASELASN